MAVSTSIRTALAGFIGFGVLASAPILHAAPGDKPGWEITFQDEFDGSALDLTKWKPRYKWGEAVLGTELQAYVDDAFEEQNGILSIVGKHQPGQYAGKTLEYRSGVICSLHEQTYGYFEARLKVPKGKGYWPAFWLLGAVGTTGVNEIDIHEILGDDTTKAYTTVHWGTDYGAGHQSDGTSFTGPDFSTDFHVFGVEWDADKIAWSIDGVERFNHTGAGVPQVDMYVILNLAIGGDWPGAPDSTTTFPGYYQIDYVRAYRRSTSDAGAGGSAGASSGGSGGTSASGGGTSSGGTTAKDSGTSGGSGGASKGGAPAKSDSGDSSGCSCRSGRESRSGRGLVALCLVLAAGFVRRRYYGQPTHA